MFLSRVLITLQKVNQQEIWWILRELNNYLGRECVLWDPSIRILACEVGREACMPGTLLPTKSSSRPSSDGSSPLLPSRQAECGPLTPLLLFQVPPSKPGYKYIEYSFRCSSYACEDEEKRAIFISQYTKCEIILTAGYISQQQKSSSQHFRYVGGLISSNGNIGQAMKKNPESILPYHKEQYSTPRIILFIVDVFVNFTVNHKVDMNASHAWIYTLMYMNEKSNLCVYCIALLQYFVEFSSNLIENIMI